MPFARVAFRINKDGAPVGSCHPDPNEGDMR